MSHRQATLLTLLVLVGTVVVGLPAVAAQETTTEAVATQNDSASGMGTQLTAFLQSNSAAANDTVENGMWKSAYNQSNETERTQLVTNRAGSLEQRLERLQERNATLEQQYENGTISEQAYVAQRSRLVAEIEGLQTAINDTDAAAEQAGVSDAALEQLKQNASEFSGQQVASVARGIAGPPENVGPDGEGQGPPEDAGVNRSEQGPPGDVGPNGSEQGPSDDAGPNRSEGGPPDNVSAQGATESEQGPPDDVPPQQGNNSDRGPPDEVGADSENETETDDAAGGEGNGREGGAGQGNDSQPGTETGDSNGDGTVSEGSDDTAGDSTNSDDASDSEDHADSDDASDSEGADDSNNASDSEGDDDSDDASEGTGDTQGNDNSGQGSENGNSQGNDDAGSDRGDGQGNGNSGPQNGP